MVEGLGEEKFKECNVVKGTEVENELRCAESISRISYSNIWFSRAFDRPLRVALNVGPDD